MENLIITISAEKQWTKNVYSGPHCLVNGVHYRQDIPLRRYDFNKQIRYDFNKRMNSSLSMEIRNLKPPTKTLT